MPFAHQASQAPYTQAIPGFGAVYLMQMLEAPTTETHSIDADEVGVFQ
jgi:hypothetical protein